MDARTTFVTLPSHEDGRGFLVWLADQIPFPMRRLFWIRDVPKGAKRGCHAHLECWQAMTMLAGSARIDTCYWENGEAWWHNDRLDSANLLLLVPPMTWIEVCNFSNDAVMLVVCSHADYGKPMEWQEFKELSAQANRMKP